MQKRKYNWLATLLLALILTGCAEPEQVNGMTLPAQYDAREESRTSPVRDQGEWGNCWAFASLLALENSLLPEESWDFSEDHMLHNPSFHYREEDGGDYTMAMAYLVSWRGPVPEEEDPYGDGISPDDLTAVKHVQQVEILPEGDRDAIKEAVLRHGGVQTSLYTTITDRTRAAEYYNIEQNAYCCPKEAEPNHDVVIVGWDDDFPAEAFLGAAEGDGAFLCENSWGAEFGNQGFFYVSYFDKNIGKINAVYSGVESADNYDHIYQSDLCGWIGQAGYGESTAWGANVYCANGREQLRAAGFYAIDRDTDYEVYIARGLSAEMENEPFSNRSLVAQGHLQYAGYYTISWNKTINLRPGERFAVIIRLTTPGAIHPLAIEYDAGDGRCNVDCTDGEGYISYDGSTWDRVETEQQCNLCLKAYTRDR